MALGLTNEIVRKYVRFMLGSPTIEVELEDATIDAAVEQALSVYGTFKPTEKRGTINVLAGQQVYTLTANQVGKGIVEVFRPDLIGSPVSLDQFDVFKYHSFVPNLSPGDFMMERVWWKEVRMTAGADDDWYLDFNYDDGTATFYINPTPSEACTLHYIYVVDPTLTQLPGSDDDWLKDYTLAMCKMILGEIRSKFSGVDGAEGTITLNGDALKAEGKEEKQALEEYLSNRGQVVPPLRG